MKKHGLIIGAGIAGKILLDELRQNASHQYDIEGFVDDSVTGTVQGIPVVGTIRDIPPIVQKQTIDIVFIAIPSAQGSLIRTIINQCYKAKVKYRIIPRLVEIIQHDKVTLDLVRPVSTDDLLGRAIVKPDQTVVQALLYNKRILVTGAAGSIGSELVRQIVEFSPQELIMVDWWENGMFELEQQLKSKTNIKKQFVIGNIQDTEKMKSVFKENKPEIVFHAAAFKHVPLMEQNPGEAIKNNLLGTQNVATAAAKHKVNKFIFISTDKAVNPINIMGATKALGELLVQHYNEVYDTEFIAVRFGNVLGSYGSVVPLFQKQIAAGGPVTVTDPDMIRYFMTISEAVQLILQATHLGKGGEIFVLDMGEPVKIIDFARTLIKLSGYEPEKDIPIEIIGKRLGEKMYEELSTQEEKLKNTINDRIFVTKNSLHITGEEIVSKFEQLITMAIKGRNGSIVRTIARIIPTMQKK